MTTLFDDDDSPMRVKCITVPYTHTYAYTNAHRICIQTLIHSRNTYIHIYTKERMREKRVEKTQSRLDA